MGRAAGDWGGESPGFAVHIADVEVDPETGKTQVLRYTALQDPGTAVHPSYVEGQMQGGSVQGIGWALNEEYCFDSEGRMLNSSWLDYRMPTAMDLPMIDTQLVEVPNPDPSHRRKGRGRSVYHPARPRHRQRYPQCHRSAHDGAAHVSGSRAGGLAGARLGGFLQTLESCFRS